MTTAAAGRREGPGQGMIGVDVGGTFTDCVAVKEGRIIAAKVLVDAGAREQPVLDGAVAVGLDGVGVFNHATTVGLNAILTRDLPKVGFVTTAGHRDILDMGRAWRPVTALTDPNWRRPFGDAAKPLVPRYLRRGVTERIMADGRVLIDLDEEEARAELRALARCGVAGVAVCLLNSYVNPVHEERVRALVAEELGDVACSVSSAVSPLAKEFARASSTVIDVLMKLIYSSYTGALVDGLRARGFAGQVNFADCSAQLAPVDHAMAAPLRVLFSGPAAGTVSSAHFGGLIAEEHLICCDVGGTSCDISLVTGGQPVVNTTFEIEHDLLVNTTAGDIATIGAGGGSIVSVGENGELAVGPGSAGGDPGPACYGKGGTRPTTTDACLLMGILSEDEPLGGELRLDAGLALEAFERLETRLDLDERVRHAYALALYNISEGIVDVAVKHGIDPRDYALVAYGSAGPMLLPAVLDEVGARAVIVPPYPGLFSALGLLSTDLVYGDHRSAYLVLSDGAAEQVDRVFADMERGLRASLGAGVEGYEIRRTFDGRLVGQTWDTPFVEVPGGAIGPEAVRDMIAAFHTAYERRWGNRFVNMPVEGVTYRVEIVVPAQKVRYAEIPHAPGEAPAPDAWAELRHMGAGVVTAAEYRREDLRAGDRIGGPAIIREPMATTQVTPGQRAAVGAYGEIVITRGAP